MLIGNSPQVLGGVALGIVFSACGVSGSGRKVLSERIPGQIYISEVTTPAWRMTLNSGISQVPRPTFGSGSGLQCVYTVVISLWGTPAPKFVLEPPKTVFYWILLCIRKPQAEFQKFSSTHVSPSNRFISSPQLPLLVGTKDEEYLPIWTLYFSVHVSLHFFVDDLP